jgi:hypothetical protein
MRQSTPRTSQIQNINQMIGRVLNHNCFPTLLGKLLYVYNGRCYFEIMENTEFTKYNKCAGQIEYLPESMVICLEFKEE